MSPLETEFHQRKVQIYQRARSEVGYTASRFLQMLSDRGGVATARTLIDGDAVSSGFCAVWEAGRPDLTVEALILDEHFASLFTDEQLRTAQRRLGQR